MKRTALKRSQPLTRSKPLRKRAARRIARETPQETAYKAWAHEQGHCYGRGLICAHMCLGPIELAHIRENTGMGLKESWLDSAPMCQALHRAYDEHRGVFRGWTREARLTWMRAAIAIANLEFFKGKL